MTIKINKGILIGIIAVLILLNGAVLFTVWHIHPIRSHERMAHRDHDLEHRESMSFLLHELDLDEEQAIQLEGIRLKYFERTRLQMDRFHMLRREITEAILNDTPDLDRIRKLAEELGKIQAEIEYERVIHFGELRSFINPDQREKFEQLITDLLERTHEPIM